MINKVTDFARSKVGTQYTVVGVADTKLKILNKFPNLTKIPIIKNETEGKLFCSRLVAQAYEAGGLKIVDDSDYCAPGELNNKIYFKSIEGVIKKASIEEVKFANTESNIDRQTKITNSIFKQAREITKNRTIQNFNDLIEFVIKNPEYDKCITDVIRHSGYLDIWKYDVEMYPERYSIKSLLELDKTYDEKVMIARGNLFGLQPEYKLEKEARMYNTYHSLYQRFHLEIFELLRDLYHILIGTTVDIILTAFYFLIEEEDTTLENFKMYLGEMREISYNDWLEENQIQDLYEEK